MPYCWKFGVFSSRFNVVEKWAHFGFWSNFLCCNQLEKLTKPSNLINKWMSYKICLWWMQIQLYIQTRAKWAHYEVGRTKFFFGITLKPVQNILIYFFDTYCWKFGVFSSKFNVVEIWAHTGFKSNFLCCNQPERLPKQSHFIYKWVLYKICQVWMKIQL